MVKRYNWQIGREMQYPYEESKPNRQTAYVFDINKCIACQTCTVACKTCWTSGKGQEHLFYNNVESKPYGGYPVGWDVKLLESEGKATWNNGQLTSSTIFEEGDQPTTPPRGRRPEPKDFAYPNLGEDDLSDMIDKGSFFQGTHPVWMFYLARICNHCDLPACVAACPRNAVYKRIEDGIVLVDQQRCRGYQECIKSCPYNKVFYNIISRISEKCIACYPRVEQGLQALCVESCIGKIRLHGFINTKEEPQEDNPLDYIVKIRKLALPLYSQFGTGPNVYYIPPVHVPNVFLEQLFGPNVESAKTMYRNLANDKKLLVALMLFGASNRIITHFEAHEDYVVGWDKDGEEVARVPYTESSYVRPHFDEKHEVYRHNTA